MCSLEIEPTTFVLLTQCSTTEPQEHLQLLQVVSQCNSVNYFKCILCKHWCDILYILYDKFYIHYFEHLYFIYLLKQGSEICTFTETDWGKIVWQLAPVFSIIAS